MATDLFSEYYNNPKKSVIYTNMTCNSADSADELSFEIKDSDGVITDNDETLTNVGLDDVNVPLTQYSTEMKVISPYSFIYVKGTTSGESYMNKAYGVVDSSCDASILADPDWEYNSTITFVIKYLDKYGQQNIKFIKADGSDASTFMQACQDFFDENSIPIDSSLISETDNGVTKYFIQLTGTELGYIFSVTHITLWHYDGTAFDRSDAVKTIINRSIAQSEFSYGFNQEWIDNHVPSQYRDNVSYCINVYTSLIGNREYQKVYSLLEVLNGYISVDITDYEDMHIDYLLEDVSKYVPAYKYRNGAFKGCLVKAIYPKYNAETITDSMRSLKIAHLKDRVEEYTTTLYNKYMGVPVCVRTLRDIVDSYYCDQDLIEYNKWNRSHLNTADKWIDFDEIPHPYPDASSNWSVSTVPDEVALTSVYEDAMLYDVMGLYGYCTYLTKHNLWSNFGQLYLRTAVEDDESTDTRNLIPSFIIYNPNAFPVEVNFMTFV